MREKTEHPLSIRYNEYIKTVGEYMDTLFVYSENQVYPHYGETGEIYRANPKDVRRRSDIKDDRFPGLICVELKSGKVVGLLPHNYEAFMEGKFLPSEKTFNKLQSLSSEVQKIYRSLQPDLGLGYNWRYLGWSSMDFKDKDGSLWDKLRKIAWKLGGLRDRTQWELEKQALTSQGKETPGEGDKPAYQWEIDKDRQEVKCGKVGPIKLTKVGYKNGILFKLFRCLYAQWKKDKKGWVKERTLDKCWDKKLDRYDNHVSDSLSKLRTALKDGFKE